MKGLIEYVYDNTIDNYVLSMTKAESLLTLMLETLKKEKLKNVENQKNI